MNIINNNSNKLINQKFKFLLLIYSILIHAAVFFIFAAALKNAQAKSENTITLNGIPKVSYSARLSLNDRKGNTYDKTKNNDDFDLKAARQAINEGLSRLTKYQDKLKNISSDISSSLKVQKNKFKIEKNNIAEPVKPIPLTKKIKLEGLNEKVKPTAPKFDTAEESTDISDPDSAGQPSAGITNNTAAVSGSGSSGAVKESYGNLSGTLNHGSEVAGAPCGIKDPEIIASKMDIFKAFVSSKIKRNLKYPQNCRKLGIEGSVKLQFSIKNDGTLEGTKIIASAQNADMDNAALDALKSSEPFVPFPEELKNKEITFIIPLNYKLEDD